jgi:carboxyl-terminal processing protease
MPAPYRLSDFLSIQNPMRPALARRLLIASLLHFGSMAAFAATSSTDPVVRQLDYVLQLIASDYVAPSDESALIALCKKNIQAEAKIKDAGAALEPIFASTSDDSKADLAHALTALRTRFPGLLADRQIMDACLQGVVNGLDQHSAYFNAEQFAQLRSSDNSHSAGLGMEIGQDDGIARVITVFANTPASEANIRPGDRLLLIDGVETKGKPLHDIIHALKGTPGSMASLMVLRSGASKPEEIQIVRQKLSVPSVTRTRLPNRIIYLRVSVLQEQTLEQLGSALRDDNEGEPAQGIILDLRHNQGGILPAAIGVAAAFVQRDTAVLRVRGRSQQANMTFYARPEFYRYGGRPDPLRGVPAYVKSLPMAVLVNRTTAAGAEAIAGALRDAGRARVIGEPTFGRGSVQTIRMIAKDIALKLTTAHMYRADGSDIQGAGIQPDIVVRHNGDMFTAFGTVTDPDIAEAIKVLAGDRQ